MGINPVDKWISVWIMGLKYQETIEIRHYETNRYGELSLSALVKLLLYVSGKQTQMLLQTNDDYLAKHQLTWFILQHDLTIKVMPKVNDVITIETHAESYNQFFTHRSFKVYKNNELIIETTMKFAVVNINERKIVRITEDIIGMYEARWHKLPLKMTKIPKEVSGEVLQTQYIASHEHIDRNQHVNNAVYFDWILSPLTQTFLKTYTSINVSIIYENEVRCGDHVDVTVYLDKETTHHYLMSENKPVARAKIEWEKRE